MAIWAVTPAAGSGERFGASCPKQYLPLAGRPMLTHCIELFLASPRIDGVVVALAAGDRRWQEVEPASPSKPLLTAAGGASRAESVLAALARLSERLCSDDWALVHDAARPCLAPRDLDRLIVELRDDPVGGILAAPVADTLKRADDSRRVVATIERASLWSAQTPQMFRYGPLRRALEATLESGAAVTDEAMAMERAGLGPRLVESRAGNLKVTRPEDLALAEALLAARGMIESQ